MKREEVNIRDPYVLADDKKYYLYGTRSETCWEEAYGFDCYVSEDLINFEGPVEVFKRPGNFFATQNYWAPECYKINGSYYLVSTFGASGIKKGIYVLKSDSPLGPFERYSERLTPAEWSCIDGTIYIDSGRIYLIFSHSFEDAADGKGTVDGDFCIMEISPDLSHSVSTPKKLFSSKAAEWARPVPFAKDEFGIDEDCFFSDGPSFIKYKDGNLYMIFSSWGEHGYAVGAAKSASGNIFGPWDIQKNPIFPENGGHGMFFTDFDGNLILTLHYPNDRFKEHPTFWKITIEDGILKII
ncbi:MAG: glycoside hydrolase family 43 protein [Lachnospiraceae bacterium]|nr:glycoside hydrolase family 43 protein [Lachnospiraceae bacterium]